MNEHEHDLQPLVAVSPPPGYQLVTDRQRTYWAPTVPGEMLEGILAELVVDRAPSGEERMRWLLEATDGRHVVLPDHWDLQQRLQGLAPGTRVWIAYRGRERVRGVPSPMARYAVALWTPAQ
jgi:hypothetical protein